MTGNMNAVLVLLLLSVLSSSAALPMERPQKTLQLIQHSDTHPTDIITVENSQDVRISSFRARLKRGSSANTKKPAQYCAGCFSVIGDPTKPQQ